MSIENNFDKSKLIIELKEIHNELVDVYRELFAYKYVKNNAFKSFIDNEYKENGVSTAEKKVWNDKFCHRASYTLLNKILFVRICEDKRFMLNPEDYIAGEVKDLHIGKKLSKIGVQKWANLITNYTLGELINFAFSDMRRSYKNIILYKEDKYEILNPNNYELSLKYINDDEMTRNIVLKFEGVLNDIVEKLDANTFDFSNTEGNILGDVYEKFMDRETRKSIGQFYTPKFVIEYILKNTVTEIDVVENPFVKVADISCGSGHFLIMTYDILKEKFLSNLEILKEKYGEEVYTIKKNGKEEQLSGRKYWLKEHIHYHILKHCIYGADIDSFAVQLTTINLLLKDLDNFTDEINVIECDSLIKWEEDYDWRDLKEQVSEEFETVITTEVDLFGEEKNFEEKIRKETYRLKYKDISGINREEILKKDEADDILILCKFWSEKFDYIVGNPPYLLCQNGNVTDELIRYYKNKHEVAQYKIDLFHLFFNRGLDLLNLNGELSFISPNTYLTNIYTDKLRKKIIFESNIESISIIDKEVFHDASVDTCIIHLTKKDMNEDIKIYYYKDNKFFFDKFILQSSLKNEEKFIINVNKSDRFQFDGCVKLGDICEICFGLQTKDKSKYVREGKQDILWDKCITGKDIKKFCLRYNNLYFYNNRDEVKAGGCWNENLHTIEKIVVRQIGNPEPVCAYDENKYFSLNTMYNIILRDTKFNLKYILGILNSELLKEFWIKTFYDNKNLFPKVKKIQLEQIPIKIVNDEIQKKVEQNVSEITKYKELLYKIDHLKVFHDENPVNILSEYLKSKYEEIFIESYINRLISNLNVCIYQIYEFKAYEDKSMNPKINNNINDFYGYLEEQNIYKIIDQLVIKYAKSKELIVEIIYEYYNMVKNLDDFNQYIYECLKTSALNYIKEEVYIYCRKINERVKIEDVEKEIKEKISNFGVIIEIIRQNYPTKRSNQIIKDSINTDVCTWNAYRKNKNEDKINKAFVKYYDGKSYGLSEWSDEIHKKYFMDAIEEYTINNPNEKKANDILKIFKDLDIEDKEDYVDSIENKIKRAFS